MPIGKIVFSQLFDWGPRFEFKKCVEKYSGDFLALKFNNHASLRDIEARLAAFPSKLYHSGMKFSHISILAYMHETKDRKIYRDFFMILIA